MLQHEWKKDTEYWRVYLSALKTQHLAEMASMPAAAKLAREIRRQSHLRLVALGVSIGVPDDRTRLGGDHV